MTNYKDFLVLRRLPEDVLDEVIREGELRLSAQLESANAADQRAMSWANMLVATTSAVIAGTVSLALTEQHYILILIGGILGAALLWTTYLAVIAARPTDFAFPGNEPENWFPDQWEGYGDYKLDIRQARVEQAKSLQSLIGKNIKWAEKTTGHLRSSINLTFWAILIAAVGYGIALLGLAVG